MDKQLARLRPGRLGLIALIWLLTPAWSTVVERPPPPSHGVPHPKIPEISAESWILYDMNAEAVLASHEPDVSRPMASATKIMTTLIALENSSLTDRVEISETAAGVGEAEIGLEAGETVQLGTLLAAAMVRSANDAAMAVAEHVGGSVSGFVVLMNQRAEELGLGNTRFANPHGLDAEDHFSTASDLLRLAEYAMQLPAFAGLARTSQVSLLPTEEGQERSADTTNQFLVEYPGAIGIKTGFTNQAGLVLVGAAQRDGQLLLVVVMGSEGSGGHFRDGTTLMDTGFDHLSPYGLFWGKPILAPDPPPNPDPELDPGTISEVTATSIPTVAEPTYQTVIRSGNNSSWQDAFGWVGRYWDWWWN